ncbi:MAG: hypothetical protein ACOH2J_14785 [Allorhizobium sp.]
MQLIDVNHPFYRPLWRRIAIVVFCAGWAVVELVGQQPFWAVISGALGAYSAYRLLFTFNPKPAESDPVIDE